MAKEIKEVEGLVPTMDWPALGGPIAQSQLWVPERPYEWQKAIWKDCMQMGARVSAVTPNESGKTSMVIPVLGLSFMSAFPGAQVVSTAGVERQIEEALWPVLKNSLSKRRDEWKITEDLHITAPSVRGLPGSTWEAFTTKDPNKAEGFHSRWFQDADGNAVYAPLMIIVDEAKSFQGKVGQDIFRAFVRRCSPDIMLVISTPGVDEGPFFDTFNRVKHQWKTHEIGWHDCPHLRQGFKLQERLASIQELGEDHEFNLSWIFGKFFRKGARYVFSNMDAVNVCMSGMVPRFRGQRLAALEFSGGGDEQVMGVRDGNAVVYLEGFHEKNTIKMADIFLAKLHDFQIAPDQIIADEGGLGKPLCDYMEEKLGTSIQRYNFGGTPRDKKRYASRATEDCYELKYLLEQGVVSLPNDEELKEQIRKRKYKMKMDDTNRILLEPKEKVRDRSERSPDRLDVVIMLFSENPPNLTQQQEYARKLSACGDPRDCFRKQEEMDNNQTTTWWEDDE